MNFEFPSRPTNPTDNDDRVSLGRQLELLKEIKEQDKKRVHIFTTEDKWVATVHVKEVTQSAIYAELGRDDPNAYIPFKFVEETPEDLQARIDQISANLDTTTE